MVVQRRSQGQQAGQAHPRRVITEAYVRYISEIGASRELVEFVEREHRKDTERDARAAEQKHGEQD
jgi:hypothetical protein